MLTHRPFRKAAVVLFVVLLAAPTTAMAQRRFGRSCGSYFSGGRIGGYRAYGGFGRIGFGIGGGYYGRGFYRGCRSYFRPSLGFGYGTPYGYYGLGGCYPRYSYYDRHYFSPVVLRGGLVYTADYDNYWPANDSLAGFRYVRSEPEKMQTMVRVEPERDQDALQAQALERFGRRHGSFTDGESPPAQANGAVKRDRQVGIALGRGDKAFEDGDYDDAREEYVRAMVLAGDDARVRIALGLTEYALGSYVDASAAVRSGVSISPSLAQSSFAMKEIYGRPNDFTAHRQALEFYRKENPEDVHAMFLLGFVQYFSGQRSEGRAAFETYLANPQHDPAVEQFVEAAKEPKPQPRKMYPMR
ncbi:MAG: hypothetical protein MI923_29740 [Phycisphaerales bacterium]|nr:hypothetical protein [Phycisphaerales bacterium]